MEEEKQSEPVLKAESSGLESVSLEEVSVIVDEHSLEPKVENDAIESVSISAPQESLEVKKEEFVIPEMPAPTVGEINPELLGNKYDADEAINNQKIEVKKQQDAMEMERIRQEAAAKSQMPKTPKTKHRKSTEKRFEKEKGRKSPKKTKYRR